MALFSMAELSDDLVEQGPTATSRIVSSVTSGKKTRPETGRIRPAKARTGLVGSERGRRHSHRRARSAPRCGVSRAPRA